MQIAIVLYPDFTALDVIGPYEVLGRLPGAEVVFVAENPGLVRNDQHSLSVSPGATLDEVTNPDIVLIGGGPGFAGQLGDGKLHEWLRAVDRTSTWTTSVCTGAPILAAAGLLEGRRATTHWSAMDELERFGAIPAHERVVFDGHYVSGAGVSAGIDMSLTLAGRIAGDETAQMVQLIIEYAPEPPYQAGSIEVAPASVVESARAALT
ncbi:DJ-1/PfpI family protein [Pseudonocardia sp. N23]|uniref:DJ-1/PfpI family protein n=1 Tax=Pseudonocardia sp. N23 TaxID=1987376 RepID=UPI000BFBCD73|nr:DJ-1/PfpI family protein [Pseudonocardia sp. N23]GAY07121.1 ThiJ/PfpI family protein [Pseudonocardia sp. N23]